MKAAAAGGCAFTNLAPSNKTVLRKKGFIILYNLSMGAVSQRILWMAGWLSGEWCLTLRQWMMTYFPLIYIWRNYVLISQIGAWYWLPPVQTVNDEGVVGMPGRAVHSTTTARATAPWNRPCAAAGWTYSLVPYTLEPHGDGFNVHWWRN